MSRAELKLMLSVFNRRIAQGEIFEEIAKDYPKLTTDDLAKIREMLE